MAEKAGVSKSLVSLVINNSPRVSDKSREAVLTAARELGYRRNAAARSLVSQQSQLIGVVISSAYDMFHTEALSGVDQHVATEGYNAFAQWGRRDQAVERKAIEAFLEVRADALILVGTDLPIKELEALVRYAPVAVVGRPLRSAMLDVVAIDSAVGGSLVVEHLTELGHTRIAHIDGGTSRAARARAEGYRAAMKAAGLEPQVVRGSFLSEGGTAGAKELLDSKSGKRPTAIFAASDQAALGVWHCVRTHGLRIPDDMSLVGHNDAQIVRALGIELTTISQPAEAMGSQAAELVIARLKDAEREPQNIVVDPSLIVRGSTGPPRST